MKKSGVMLLVLLLATAAIYARGKKDVDNRPVEKKDSWQETFDINQKKQGKYNIMVTATDKGGNESIGGPYNIFIDPESDLPVTGITNPLMDMRVPGNLNIVGTCVDDDAVAKVELVLDGDKENPKLATGKEFWSYYLDTNDLSEGPHTIEVYGTDINGLRGHSKKVTWNLDRRQPVSAVTNYGLGTLVSGKIDLKGTISDGNGIKSLACSLDGGVTFLDIKISENKKQNLWEFAVPVNTRDIKDGPAVAWFKATDLMGSVGIYSFLFFVDNTTPDVKIVSPLKDQVCNGKFAVAGYAKDVIGLQKLTWTFGGESGDFELIPGNPYWYKEVDTSKISGKSADFIITALDTAGNTRVVKQTISLDQEADKPVVKIQYPTAGTPVESDAGVLFLRGIASDDDGVSSIAYTLDDGAAQTLDAQGVFYVRLSADADVAAGIHKITVKAKDIYGVEGNPVTVTFTAKGKAPVFSAAKIKSSEGTVDAVPGVLVHPESGASIESSVSADCGIASVSTKLEWGKDGVAAGDFSPKSPAKTVPLSIPLTDAPWGLVRVTVTATDIYGRTAQQCSVLHIKDITRMYTDTPAVVFDDSTVAENGAILNDPEHPVTGYFVGGNAKTVDLVPSTSFAKAELSGNIITLKAGSGVGTSSPVKVRVTTDQGVTYDSRSIFFTTDVPAPVVSVDGSDPSSPVAADDEGTVHVSGSISSTVPLVSAGYHILAANAALSGDLVTGVSGATVPSELTNLTVSSSGKFGFDIPGTAFGKGMFIVEVVAENGKQAAGTLFVRNVPAMPATDGAGKKAVMAKPVITWFDGVDVYYTVLYQGTVDKTGGVFLRSDMQAGAHDVNVQVKDEAGKPYASKFTAKKAGGMSARLDSVGGNPYASGMNVPLAAGAKDSVKVSAIVVSDFPLTTASYKVSGEKTSGGDEKQEGKAVIGKPDGNKYEVSFQLANLPSRITKISLSIENGVTLPVTVTGTVAIVRTQDPAKISDDKKVYWMPQENVSYDSKNNRYVLAAATSFTGYANVPGPVTASLVVPQPGLTVTAEGNVVKVTADKDGTYKDVAVRVRDSQGVEYKAPSVDLLADTDKPAVAIASPEIQKWVKKSTPLSITATDANGINTVEYSLDNGATWTAVPRDKNSAAGVYSASLTFDAMDDGLVSIDVRATDNAGKISYTATAIQKDTMPPDVQVIIPAAEDIVNGENRIAFIAKDSGRLVKAEYQAPAGKAKKGEAAPAAPAPIDIDLAPMITTLVGTPAQPINDLMSFNFYDAVGNVTSIRKWDFIIDAQSDLPRAEVHLPAENAVLTRDFVISGVVYDDDGPSKIWYKIDNNKYTSLPDYGTSFSLDIPLKSMTDNEHSVTVYAEDIHGVVGPEFVRNFRISLEEPKGAVVTPPISETVRGTVTLTGKASDKNGINKVQVSLDNGNTFNDAVAKYGHDQTDIDWSYTFDTRVIQDGTHVVFIKIFDGYDIEGLYSSLINIDNTNPQINLELPLDDSKTTGMIFFSGQTTDNIGLTQLYITIRSLDGKVVSQKLARTDLVPGEIITQAIDLSSLDNGFYNVELTGSDAADNITRVSRNVQLNKNAPLAKVDLLYPLNGEHVQGKFNIYGTAVSEKAIDNLFLYIDDVQVAQTTLSQSGYYKFSISPEFISDGTHKVKVQAVLSDTKMISSNEQTVMYKSVGPWVTIDNFTYGDFAIERPFLMGNAGYAIAEDELLAARAKGAAKELKAALEAKAVEKVEISFDNGKTFEQISKAGKWRYRIENEDIAEGYHFLLVRATMKNGEKAVTRTIIQVDKTKPTIKLISPGEGGHYNQQLEFSGLAHDDVALKSVVLALRKGDKASYEVPAFIQGLYFDWHFWGATLFDIGAGLTFFDDNVKLQVQWGQFTQTQRNIFSKTDMRYGGDNVLGAKILANVAYMPMRYYFGPDFEWLSANFAVGANFTRFNETGSGKAQILSAVLAQLEFPRVTFAKQKMFRTISFYTEGQLWFIPTDVTSTVDIQNMVPQISCGLRVNVF
jgi:hypothetical protein